MCAEKDVFLKRAGGTRRSNLSKDAALQYYIKQLGHPHLIIYHTKLSCNGYLPVFTLKTLSHYLGGHLVHPNAGKILLLELQSAVEIFGYAHAMQGSLAGSYLTFTGLALSMGEKDPSRLTDSGKRYLLRNTILEDVQEAKEGETQTLETIDNFEDMLSNE